jgi:hypothetical protein
LGRERRNRRFGLFNRWVGVARNDEHGEIDTQEGEVVTHWKDPRLVENRFFSEFM